VRRRTIADLRSDAKALIPHANLEQVYAVNTSLRVHDRNGSTPLTCETDLLVKGERAGRFLEAWARYETTAHTADAASEGNGAVDGDTDSPGAAATHVWTALVEGVAVFELDDPDLVTTEDQVEAFALLVGMPILHPYAREWTQTLTGHSQYPAFTLGLIESPAELDSQHVVELPDREATDSP
jgi:hypothetical protein